jgi:hypothetical protein
MRRCIAGVVPDERWRIAYRESFHVQHATLEYFTGRCLRYETKEYTLDKCVQYHNLDYVTDECQTRMVPYVTDECNTYSDQMTCWKTDKCERYDQKCFPGDYCSVWATCPAPVYGDGAYGKGYAC